MAKKRNIFIFVLLIFLVIFVFTSRGYIGSLVHPLPFDGPYRGTVVDASTGNPIANAKLIAYWSCRDFPYPHIGEYSVYTQTTSNEKGHYEIKKPRRRGGWFGGDFSFTVYAKGYIRAEFFLRPGSPSITGDTKTHPFYVATSVPTFPAVFNVRLKPAKPILLEALKSEKARHRGGAARQLGKIGSEARYAVEPLIYTLKDQDAAVRRCAAGALGDIGPGAKSSTPALIAALKDEDGRVQLGAIDALGNIGHADDDIMSALIKLLTDKDNSVRTHAVRSLAKLGPGAKAAVPALKDMLGEKFIDKYLRREVEYALKKIEADTMD
ncbi:MAG: HEAT repeat domain-containing protein [Thermodesulfobacteriota bacterium]|nr:HEAT repeat domain-containing protein [Thermodesulfobacteriota bacterium]